MADPAQLVSPKQVARAIGISESSLKRWCDQGLIQTVRTIGGHRKMPIADVIRFVRERGYAFVSPEVLGLPPASDQADHGLRRGKLRLIAALMAGDEELAERIIFDLYLSKHALSLICDQVIAEAFHEIGDRWACHECDVYQERRGCEITIRLLANVRKLLPQSDRRWTAIGGTIAGDSYALSSVMAELVLREVGLHATNMGNSIPLPSLIKAVQDAKPKLFWLSVSHISEDIDFVAEFRGLSTACEECGTALVVGGRALTNELRQQMSYSAYGDTMQHLESFARILLKSLRSSVDASSNTSSRNRKANASQKKSAREKRHD